MRTEKLETLELATEVPVTGEVATDGNVVDAISSDEDEDGTVVDALTTKEDEA